jgi:hypothetical protein
MLLDISVVQGRVVKAGLKNCTMCRGCTAELEDIGNKSG